ncbi:permease, partial [Enterococcus faecalis]
KARVFWRMLPVIIISFTVILLLALLGFGWLLEQIFTGASFDKLTATLILGVSIYAVSALWGQIAEQIRATWLTTVFTVIMISGVFISMA